LGGKKEKELIRWERCFDESLCNPIFAFFFPYFPHLTPQPITLNPQPEIRKASILKGMGFGVRVSACELKLVTWAIV
jgi:hypothetical protein